LQHVVPSKLNKGSIQKRVVSKILYNKKGIG
jgi:hypothetical protein